MARSISLLIDSPLRDLSLALRAVGPELRSQIGAATKAAADPIWFEETRARAVTKLQQRVLVDTARTSVTGRGATLMAGGAGKLSTGTPTSLLAGATEFGMDPDRMITTRSRNKKVYKRRAGNAFKGRIRQGHVVYRAANDSIPRFASLWVQTARRCIHEALEKGTA